MLTSSVWLLWIVVFVKSLYLNISSLVYLALKEILLTITVIPDVPVGVKDGLSEYICEKYKRKFDHPVKSLGVPLAEVQCIASYPGSRIMWGRKRELGDYCVAHALKFPDFWEFVISLHSSVTDDVNYSPSTFR